MQSSAIGLKSRGFQRINAITHCSSTCTVHVVSLRFISNTRWVSGSKQTLLISDSGLDRRLCYRAAYIRGPSVDFARKHHRASNHIFWAGAPPHTSNAVPRTLFIPSRSRLLFDFVADIPPEARLRRPRIHRCATSTKAAQPTLPFSALLSSPAHSTCSQKEQGDKT